MKSASEQRLQATLCIKEVWEAPVQEELDDLED